MQALTLALTLFFCLGTVHAASISETFGLGARNFSLGGSSAPTSPGPFSAKGNPATLVRNKKIQAGVAYMNAELELKNSGFTRSDNKASGIANDEYQAKNAENLSIVHFGLSVPLSKYLSAGVAGTLPTNNFARIHSFTGAESNYLMFNDRQQNPEIYTGLGIKLPSNFAVGFGILYTVKAQGTMQLGVSDNDAQARFLVELKPEFVPYGGALYTYELNETDKLDFGLTYRHQLKPESTIDTDVRFDVGALGTIPFSASSNLVAFYEPAVVSLGTGYSTGKYSLFGAVERRFWSKYESPILKLSGPDLAFLNGSQGGQENIKLEDTFSFRAGIEVNQLTKFLGGDLLGRVGVEYHESALGDNPSSLVVVDTDRQVLSAGLGLALPKMGSLIDKPLVIDIGAKWIRLNQEQLQAYQGNTAFQQAKVGGDIFSVAGGMSFEF